MSKLGFKQVATQTVSDRFTFPPQEVVLRTCIAIKDPSFSAGFDSANIGSNASTITTKKQSCSACKDFVTKLEGERSLERLIHGW
jgi:hypothetical protein